MRHKISIPEKTVTEIEVTAGRTQLERQSKPSYPVKQLKPINSERQLKPTWPERQLKPLYQQRQPPSGRLFVKFISETTDSHVRDTCRKGHPRKTPRYSHPWDTSKKGHPREAPRYNRPQNASWKNHSREVPRYSNCCSWDSSRKDHPRKAFKYSHPTLRSKTLPNTVVDQLRRNLADSCEFALLRSEKASGNLVD